MAGIGAQRPIVAAERTEVIEPRDGSIINGEVLPKVERDIDLQELRMEA